MARFSASFCLRMFGAGVVLATAFSLQAPLSSRSTAAPAGKSLAFAPPKAAAGVPAAAGLMKENDFTFRLQSVAGGAAATPAKKNALVEKFWNEDTKLATYISVWYLGNIYYNIYNKKALNMLGKNGEGHWALAAVQLLVGACFVIPQWVLGVRAKPGLTLAQWKALAPIGVFNAAAHGASVLALGAGAVSFGQIVKAGEPVHAALTGAVLLKEIDHPLVYLSLLPIIGGVALASLKELDFKMKALIFALCANQAAAFKNVVAKKTGKENWAKKLGPQNMYAVVTILAFLATMPLVLLQDLPHLKGLYQGLEASGKLKDMIKFAVYSGLNFYVYNEFSFLALSKLSPVTHSVANTLKRVVIIVASCIVFRTPTTFLGNVGSAIAVLGTLLYSLSKKKYSGSAH